MDNRIYMPTKTFFEWCIENDRMDLNDRFDVEKNGCTTKDIGYQSNKKVWFKCPANKHESEAYYMYHVTKHIDTDLKCRKCNSLAQAVIDNFGEEYLLSHWHKNNIISPWDISYGSLKKVLIQCHKHDYHVYEQSAIYFGRGIGCPYCINKIVHPLDSLGAVFPEIINRWSDKNKKSPYEYAPHSESQVWFKCPCGEHDDYQQRISNAVTYGFTCRKCEIKRFGLEHRGENAPGWKGGILSYNKILRKRSEYNEWRESVYKRDSYTCQCCGKVGGRLNAHHLLSFADYEDMRLEINNGITLCEDCHDSTKEGSFHNLYGTHGKSPDELRKYILDKSNIDIYETHPEILSLTIQN